MPSIRKHGHGYQVRYYYYDANGQEHEKTKSGFRTKSAAKLFASQLEIDIHNGLDLVPKDPKFADYFDYFYHTYKEPKIENQTKNRYKITSRVLHNYFGDVTLKSIDRPQYQAFINFYGHSHAKDTVYKVNSLIRATVQNAILDDLIHKDFTQRVSLIYDKSRDKHVEYLNVAEIKRLIAYLENHLNYHFTSTFMILTAVLTGARLGEIQALTWNDVNFSFKTISITKSWNSSEGGGFKDTKTAGSNRIIAVNDELLKSLKILKDHNNGELIFVNQYKSIPSSSAVNKKLRSILKDLGIKKQGFHFHSLRHSHVAYLLSRGIDIYIISKRLGHADVSTTTKVYSYLMDEYKAKNDQQIREELDSLSSHDGTIPIKRNL